MLFLDKFNWKKVHAILPLKTDSGHFMNIETDCIHVCPDNLTGH